MIKQTTLFISDLHLQESQPQITEVFLTFLKSCKHNIDALYILGDFFEAWIGDDDVNAFHQKVIQALHTATQAGLPIYMMHGNRDFLIGKKFLKATGCKLLADETVIDVYGTKVLLLHGDTLCTLDENYIKARKKLRNPFIQKVFLSLPLSLRRIAAKKMRAKSQDYTKTASVEIMDVTPTEVKKVLALHHLDLMIHGHTHKPGVHAERIVLGAWHENGNALSWNITGERKLISF